MAEPQPVLLIDAGGTLITRTRPGLTTRVVQAVRQARELTADQESRLRAAVLTAADPDACLRALDLAPDTRSLVAAVLAEDPGEALVLPGAEELLRTACELGWRVIVASNAGPGTPELPEELGRHLSGVVESRDCGLVKEDPRFWTRLIETERIDPRLALVVGDHEQADRRAPAAAGLQSRLVAAGLASLTADLQAAGPAPAQALAVVAGDHEDWAGRDIVVAPHLEPMVVRVTRARVKYSSGAGAGTAVVVKRRSSLPAVVGHQEELPGMLWLLQGRERSPYTVPASLHRLLEEKGLSLDVLSAADQRHALSMLHEARADSTVAERTADLVRFLEDRTSKIARIMEPRDDARP
ncbi:FMN phosphatase YigB (HAD superfamily) [Kitasatospora sp. MAP12-15]|uniref:HAD family hydrolase n=1 Tax=unclassified Kitasatospora TaxID=2633591 RepID=UPI002473B14B|nr:HAD family hydrolase [Kitasatospora sp. MAP12-44]MDH6108193.1 FMN phosphatase YigB (HAD superfamily) [Kitasatospora sp. MAP12-44]